MPIDPLPSISRSDANFRTKVDDYFLTRLPAFSTQAESARAQIVAAESTTTSAASTASTDATTATTAANTATSARDSAVTAKNAAETAAAQAVSGNVATPIHEAVSKNTPVDADELGLSDSAASWGLKKLTFANLKAWIGGLFVSKSGDTINGDLNFSGAGRRITGDFSNATTANRLALQSSTTNGNTSVTVLPNGTSTTAAVTIFNGSDPANSGYAQIVASSGAVELLATARGTGSAIPLRLSQDVNPVLTVGTNRRVLLTPNNENFALQLNNGAITNGPFLGSAGADIFVVSTSGGTEVLRTDAGRNVLVTGSGALGYGVGSGGTVTQTTSKSTEVTLNKPCGQITMHGAEVGASATVGFVLGNTSVSTTDVVAVSLQYLGSAAQNYDVWAAPIGTAQAAIYVRNISGTARSDALIINFAVIKGAAS